MKTTFHLSLPCLDVEETRNFYGGIEGVRFGRSSTNWLDVDLYGHQLTFNASGRFSFEYPNYSFEKHVLPAFHFGVILSGSDWERLYSSVREGAGEEEKNFLSSRKGAHRSFFLTDPNGYVLEFKSFVNPQEVFSAD
jgi:extradiol dioxygenase family protein